MSSSVDRVEVFAGIQRRRRYSVDQKLAVLQEAIQPGMTISYVARRHGIAPSLVFGWRRRMTEGGKEAIRADDTVVAKAEVRALERRIQELERERGADSAKLHFLTHYPQRWIVSLGHKSNLRARDKDRIGVIQHRIHRVRCATIVAIAVASQTNSISQRDS